MKYRIFREYLIDYSTPYLLVRVTEVFSMLIFLFFWQFFNFCADMLEVLQPEREIIR